MKATINKGYLLFIFFIWIFPNHGVVDPIGSQWFYLSILNFLMCLFTAKELWQKKYLINFNLPVIWALFALFFWALGSYWYAINTVEVLIESFRLFTLLTTLLLTAFALSKIQNKVRFIAGLFSISLTIEVLLFLLPTLELYSQTGVLNRETISKGISSNVNIASFSMLYKVPITLYFLNQWSFKFKNIVGFILLTSTVFSISLFATRGAILGVFILAILYLINIIIQKNGQLGKRWLMTYFFPVIVALALNQIIKTDELDVVNRVNTITKLSADQSIGQRLDYYTFSLKQIFEHPIMGFGYGNWKLASIPEMLDKQNSYVVPYHSHNDFLQLGAELGIVGLLIYLLFFYGVIDLIIKGLKDATNPPFYFALLLFVVVYFIDANLNFPIARPIIQIPLLIIVGFLISESVVYKSSTALLHRSKNALFVCFTFLIILLQPFVVYSNTLVFKSFVEQTKLLRDFNSFTFKGDLQTIEAYESDYPNIGATTLPLKTLKALYFVGKDNEKALAWTKSAIKDNPYLYVSESLLALLYADTKQLDSALFYAKKAYTQAPSIDLHAATYLPFISETNDTTELRKISGLLQKSDSPYIWNRYIETLLYLKDTLDMQEKKLIKTAANKFPNIDFFKAVDLSKNYKKSDILKADSIAKIYLDNFKAKNYTLYINGFLEAANLAPFEPAYIENTARSYMLMKDYPNAIVYFNKLIDEFKVDSGLPEFYIGTIYYKLNQSEKGCNFIIKAMDKNFSAAKRLYASLCLTD